MFGGMLEIPRREVPAESAIEFHNSVPCLFFRLRGLFAGCVDFVGVGVRPHVEFTDNHGHVVFAFRGEVVKRYL